MTDAARPLDLKQQEGRACDLHAAARVGEPAALARLHRHLGLRARADDLADAQRVIARELGLENWDALVDHIARMEAAQQAIDAGAPAPDGGRDTLHVRCGSDIREGLRAAGFTGDFLEYSDPICQGPVVDAPDYFVRRGQFIAAGYVPSADAEAVADRLCGEAEALQAAPDRYEEIVLWFEHDSYDQLLLARALATLSRRGLECPVHIVSIDRFPGIDRFTGLGQLTPAALRCIHADRRSASAATMSKGQEIWDALRASSPHRLAALAEGPECPGLPYMQRALRRHLAELPGADDGLSLTERLTLELLRAGPLSDGRLFGMLVKEHEPLPFLGDLMFFHVVRTLAEANVPPLEAVEPEGRDGCRPVYRLTDCGRALLDGRGDLAECGARERWVGGVRCFAVPDWRWRPGGGITEKAG